MKSTYKLKENEFSPAAVHPGEHILDELRARKMRQKELAVLIETNNTILNEIIKGKRKISISLALKLEKALGISAEAWLNLQRLYEKQAAYEKTAELLSRMKIPKKNTSLLRQPFNNLNFVLR